MVPDDRSTASVAQVRARIAEFCAARDGAGAFLTLAGSAYTAEEHPGLWEYLARRLQAAGAADLASQARRVLARAGMLRGQAAIEEAETALAASEPGLALTILDAAFDRDSPDDEVNRLFAAALMHRDPVAAVAHLRRLSRDTLRALLAYVDGLRRANLLSEADAALAEAERRFPAEPRIAARRARMKERRYDWSGALADWRKLAAEVPAQRIEGLFKVMELSRRMGDEAQVTAAFADLAVGAGGRATTLSEAVDALLFLRQPGAVRAYLTQEAAPARRGRHADADWVDLAQSLLSDGHIGLAGWLEAQGLPVGPVVNTILRQAPLTAADRAAVRGPIARAAALLSPDVLLADLARSYPRAPRAVFAHDPILLVNASLAAGGAERQFVTLVRALLRRGVAPARLHVALFDTSSERGNAHFLPDLQDTGVALHVLPETPARPEPGAEDGLVAALPLALRSDLTRLLPLVRDLRPGILQGWQDRASLACGLAGVMSGTPRIVLSARNMRPDLRNDGRLSTMRGLMRQLCLWEGIVLAANAEAAARDYGQWLDLPDGGVRTLLNGLDLDRFRIRRPARPAAPSGPRVVEVLGVFRLAANKRPLLWLRTFALLKARLPFPIRGRIVGVGALRDDMLREMEALGITGDVTLEGRIDDPARIYGASDMLLLMSRVEGTPNVVIEAQACGMAVAACDVGGTAEALLQEGASSGLLLPAEITEEEAARQIADWLPAARLADPGPRRAFVTGRYDMTVLADTALSLYGLVPGPQAGAA